MRRERVVDQLLQFESLRTELQGLADEIAIRFAKSSFSPVIRDYLDYSTAICDGHGRMVAQGFSLPLHLGAIPRAMRTVLSAYPHGLRTGDVAIFNDPYAGGMHLPDIFMVAPAAVGETLIGHVVIVAHHADIGGRVPGGSAADSREIFEEGLRLPPVLLQRAGRIDRQVEAIIKANVRLPNLVWNDLEAQLAGCVSGSRALEDLVVRQASGTFTRQLEALRCYSRERLEAVIGSWPDGTYRFEDWEDHDGITARRVPLRVAVTIEGSRIAFDFTGTSPQVPGAINATLSFTESACYAAVRALCAEDIPVNAGFFEPIAVHAPEGTITNARFPAAVAARGVIGYRIIETIYGALSAALPDRVPAAGDGGITGIRFGGYREDGARFQLNDIMCSAWGARPGLDGVDGAATMAANVANRSIERAEQEDPVRVLAYEFVPDTGGAGTWRGGLAIRRALEFLEVEATLQVRTHRSETPPFGLHGGLPGACSQTHLTHAGVREKLPGKATLRIERGDVVEHITAGGGGWGDPGQRPHGALEDDLAEGKVTQASAVQDYGVEPREHL